MKRQLSLFSAAILLSATTSFSQTTASSEPVGFVTVTVPANSDAVLAVPLNRSAVFKGVIQSISGSTITVAGTSPAWATDQFVQDLVLPTLQTNTYAVQLASGTKEGMIAKVTANGANTVTVQFDAGDDFTSVKTEAVDGAGLGDQIDIFPYWTPSTLITSTVAQDSQILLLNSTNAGVNLSSSGAFLYDAGNWFDDGFAEANHAPMNFGSAFVFRNGGAANTISVVGSVPMNKHRLLLRTRANNVDQDIGIGFSSPVPAPVGSLGLTFAEDDQILVFNNSATGQNKSASVTLYYTTADGWVDDGFTPVGNTFMLQPGQGYIFRKKGTPTPQTLVWTALQPYLQ